MTQTWIVFKINNQTVSQITGDAGTIRVSAWKSVLAYQHGVTEAEVKVSSTDELVKIQSQKSITSSELISDLKIEMTRNTFKN